MSPSSIRGGLDSSVVVRLLTGDPVDQSRIAVDFIAKTTEAGQRVVVSNLVVSEVYFACQHYYQLSKTEVIKGMRDLLSDPVFLVDPSTLGLLGKKNISRAKPGFIDRVIHAEYTDQGVPLITFEKSSRRLRDCEALKA